MSATKKPRRFPMSRTWPTTFVVLTLEIVDSTKLLQQFTHGAIDGEDTNASRERGRQTYLRSFDASPHRIHVTWSVHFYEPVVRSLQLEGCHPKIRSSRNTPSSIAAVGILIQKKPSDVTPSVSRIYKLNLDDTHPPTVETPSLSPRTWKQMDNIFCKTTKLLHYFGHLLTMRKRSII